MMDYEWKRTGPAGLSVEYDGNTSYYWKMNWERLDYVEIVTSKELFHLHDYSTEWF